MNKTAICGLSAALVIVFLLILLALGALILVGNYFYPFALDPNAKGGFGSAAGIVDSEYTRWLLKDSRDVSLISDDGLELHAYRVDGADPEHCHPRYIDAVARDFPKLKIVVSHGCYPWVNEIIMVVQRNRNVYLELSEYEQSPFSEGYIQAANTMIGDKVIFASAHPFLDFKGQIALYRKLPFSPQALENIFYNNAAKLLGL